MTGEYQDEEILNEPSPLNIVAIIAFVVSLGSIAFVSDSVYFFLPLLTIVLAIVALIQQLLARRKLWGGTLAAIALFLGIFAVSWRVSYEQMRADEIKGDSVEIGLKWLDYVSTGKLMEAHQLTKKFSDREMEGESLSYLYRDISESKEFESRLERNNALERSPFTELKKFKQEPVVSLLLEHADEASFEFVKNAGHLRRDPRNDVVENLYRMNYKADGTSASKEFWLVLGREDRGAYFNGHWHVDRIREFEAGNDE